MTNDTESQNKLLHEAVVSMDFQKMYQLLYAREGLKIPYKTYQALLVFKWHKCERRDVKLKPVLEPHSNVFWGITTEQYDASALFLTYL